MSLLSDRAIDAISVIASELGEGTIHVAPRYGRGRGVFVNRLTNVDQQQVYIAGSGPEQHTGGTPRDALERLRDAVPEFQEADRVL